jgi:hypothetical protein
MTDLLNKIKTMTDAKNMQLRLPHEDVEITAEYIAKVFLRCFHENIQRNGYKLNVRD